MVLLLLLYTRYTISHFLANGKKFLNTYALDTYWECVYPKNILWIDWKCVYETNSRRKQVTTIATEQKQGGEREREKKTVPYCESWLIHSQYLWCKFYSISKAFPSNLPWILILYKKKKIVCRLASKLANSNFFVPFSSHSIVCCFCCCWELVIHFVGSLDNVSATN